MNDSMVAVTYHFEATFDERVSNGFGENERTGNALRRRITRTIVVPKSLREDFLEIDWKAQQRVNKDAERVGGIEAREIILTYPAPHY
tara:strand:- start:154 stop:417 length:264 start_codon:yes stop_codon:yes gene_type:complete